MNEDSTKPPGSDHEAEQRIRVLADQEHQTSPDFMRRVRSRIDRRASTSQFASYSWYLPRTVLIEIAGMLGHFLRAFGAKKEL